MNSLPFQSDQPDDGLPWSYDWMRQHGFRDITRSVQDLRAITQINVSSDLITQLWRRLEDQLPSIDDPDEAIHWLHQFIVASNDPTSLLSLFERDSRSLAALLQVMSTSSTIANLLVSDPENFDLIRARDGQPTQRRALMDELITELDQVRSPRRAGLALRRFTGREVLRIAYGEFVRDMPPAKVQRQLSYVTDAVLHAALEFSLSRTVARQGMPQRIDGSSPRYAIIGLGNYGGLEIGYDAPLPVLLLCDQIDRKNPSHVRFNRTIIKTFLDCVGTDRGPVVSLHLTMPHQPEVVEGDSGPSDPLDGGDSRKLSSIFRGEMLAKVTADFYSVDEAASYYQRTSRTWQRLAFVKARLAAGDRQLAKEFFQRIHPWVYQSLLSRSEMADIRVLRRKLEKRVASFSAEQDMPIADVPGGRHDIELTVQYLQLLHGNALPDLRVTNTIEAITELGRFGCLTNQEATILSENHAKLCRLEHQLAVLFDHRVTHLPRDVAVQERLAWRLHIRRDGRGDADRLTELLHETFDVNRKIINHLMVDPAHATQALADESIADDLDESPSANMIEHKLTELVLDPEPNFDALAALMRSYQMEQPASAVDAIETLSTETVSFLSPRRCRHFFAAVAPRLLSQLAQMPNPDAALKQLVDVTDSIGAKATLWELLRTSDATMNLMVRMVALAPYLSNILIQHPGMIDELIDSLVRDRLPSAERLDAQSQRLVTAGMPVAPVLRNFKASAHLMIGVRDLLDKDPIERIGQALTNTSEAILRRLIERETETLAARYGDPGPVSKSNRDEPAELIAIALQKFGGCETNYHSDLDI
ncbi:MAG: glutamate-ammonia-ligase adenylyltransferase, partial [Planctomycetota bacterium]